MATKEYFPGIGKIRFEGKDSRNPLAFRYYDPEKVVYGKKMKDWFKFAMALAYLMRRRTGSVWTGNTEPPMVAICRSRNSSQGENGCRF